MTGSTLSEQQRPLVNVGNKDVFSEVSMDDVAPELLSQSDGQIQICFSTTTGWLSWWIRMYTGSRVSHALLTFRSATLGRVCVIEAHGGGFRIVPWSRWERKNTLIARFTIVAPPEATLRSLRAISLRLGDPYDVVGLIGFIPGMWYRLQTFFASRWRVRNQGQGAQKKKWLPRFRNFFDNPKRLFCSEAIAEFLLFATENEDFARPQDWSPENLFQYATHRPDVLTLVDNDLNSEKTKRRQQELPKSLWKNLDTKACSIRPGRLDACR